MNTEPAKPTWLPNPPVGWSQWEYESIGWVSRTVNDTCVVVDKHSVTLNADHGILRRHSMTSGFLVAFQGMCQYMGGEFAGWLRLDLGTVRHELDSALANYNKRVEWLTKHIRECVLLPFCRANRLLYDGSWCFTKLGPDGARTPVLSDKDAEVLGINDYGQTMLYLETGALGTKVGRVSEDDL